MTKRSIKGEEKVETKEFWCEICGAACDEITEENYPDLEKARTLCPRSLPGLQLLDFFVAVLVELLLDYLPCRQTILRSR